jgi:hypothetical protein
MKLHELITDAAIFGLGAYFLFLLWTACVGHADLQIIEKRYNEFVEILEEARR